MHASSNVGDLCKSLCCPVLAYFGLTFVLGTTDLLRSTSLCTKMPNSLRLETFSSMPNVVSR